VAGHELLQFFLPLMPSSPSPDAPDVFQVSNISVCLTYQEVVAVEKPPGKNKKGEKPKMQTKTKNKEISFSFEDNTNNYLNFLSTMLVKHGIECDLGQIRGLLEKKWANPDDGGYTYVADDGKRILLTPSLLLEWSRAIVSDSDNILSPLNAYYPVV